MSIWFTSDLHIGHKNIAGPTCSNWDSGYRTFDSIEEHDKTILDNINSYVEPDDTLYILGDITFKSKQHLSAIIARINCNNIHLLIGNHDNALRKIRKDAHSYKTYTTFFNKVKSINDYLKIKITQDTIPNPEQYRLVLFHYPIGSWDGMYRNSIQLHGHSHNSYTPKGKQLDVGVDSAYHLFNEYRPFSLQDIIDITSTKQIDYTIDNQDQHD